MHVNVPIGGKRLSMEEAEAIRDHFMRLYSGPSAAFVLSGAATWTPIPTIDESIARLDRVIANVRRFV